MSVVRVKEGRGRRTRPNNYSSYTTVYNFKELLFTHSANFFASKKVTKLTLYVAIKFLNELFMTTSSVETFPAVDSGGFNFKSIHLTNIIFFYKKAHPLTNNK